jgi:hypothetical protein
VRGRRARRHGDGERGTASVELVGVLPFAIVAVLVAAQIAVAGATLWSAAIAARAGARAALVGDGPLGAAREALPSLLRRGAEVRSGNGVSVEVAVPHLIPGLPDWRLEAHTSLEAGRRG